MPVYEEKEKVNGQKRYYIRLYVNDEYGKVKQIERHNKNWVGREGKKEAEWEENRLKNKTIATKANVKLYDLCDEYLREVEMNSKFSTVDKHTNNINRYIKKTFPNQNANKITTKNVLAWKEKINNFPLELNTKKSIFTTFSAIMQHGCKYYNFEVNPFRVVGNFSAKKGHKKKNIIIMPESSLDDFLKYEKNENYKLIYTILFYTGMRRGELLALTWNDIDFRKKEINIGKTLDPKREKKKKEFYKNKKKDDDTPKTNKSNRKIIVTENVIECLKQLKAKNFTKPTEFVTLTTLKRHCDNNCKKINLLDFRIHDFRHSFASMCIDKNVPISILSSYLGHENITTTLDTYGHLYPNSQEKLINILENKNNDKNRNNSFDYVFTLMDKALAEKSNLKGIISYLESIVSA